jgi:hypothetical protein
MALLAAATATLLLAAPSSGATFTVTSNGDSGAGTLRRAITDAEANNNDPTADLIQFDPAVTVVNLDSTLPTITHPLTIDGPGADALDIRRSGSASGDFRLFAVIPGMDSTVTIRDATISGTRATGFSGGALSKSGVGTLILDSAVFTDNRASTAGAISFADGFTSIRNSTFNLNQATAGSGGAIVGRSSSPTVHGEGEVINSTIAGNSATLNGGGIAVIEQGRITVNSSTIQGNTADSDNSGGGSGGGTQNQSTGTAPTFSVANTLYAGNTVGSSGTATTTQCGGTYASSGFNLRTVSEAGCMGFDETSDIVNANPMLGTLGDNGGPTPTIALLTGSPAIDAGNPDSPLDGFFPTCPTTDQRGVSRLGPNRCDIGAFEKRSPTTTTLACSPSSLTLGSGSSACTATVTDVAGLVSPSGPVSFKTAATGTFSSGGTCTLAMSSATTASCSVSYTPGAVGTGSHLIGAFYEGTADLTPSNGSDEIAVAPPPQPVPPVTPGTSFDLKAAIKKCKKKFPKGPKRKKCIKRAKRRAQA